MIHGQLSRQEVHKYIDRSYVQREQASLMQSLRCSLVFQALQAHFRSKSSSCFPCMLCDYLGFVTAFQQNCDMLTGYPDGQFLPVSGGTNSLTVSSFDQKKA